MNLFGRKKAAPAAPAAAAAAVAPMDAIANLAKQQETLTKRQDYLEKQMQQLAAQAVERNKKGDKKGALVLLRRRKAQEGEITKLYAMITNIESMKNAMQSNSLNADYFHSVHAATNVLDRQQATMNPEAVEDMRDKYEEVMDKQKEMDDVLGQVWGANMGPDDAELESELAEMEAATLEAELMAPPRVAAPAAAMPAARPAAAAAAAAPAPLPSFPSAPSSAPVVAAQPAAAPARSMEDELAALEASLA